MKIECGTLKDFLDCIEGMVHRGLTFTANASTLVITLTGGF